MTRARKIKADADQESESIAALRKAFPIGSTAFTVLRSVSSSGMSRRISVIGIARNQFGEVTPDAEPVNYSWDVARVMGWPLTDDHALVIGGVGMDMGFHVIYSLSRVLYSDDMTTDAGYAIGQRWL